MWFDYTSDNFPLWNDYIKQNPYLKASFLKSMIYCILTLLTFYCCTRVNHNILPSLLYYIQQSLYTYYDKE